MMPTNSLASETKTLKVGDVAPDFELPVANKDSVGYGSFKLSDYRDKQNVVLAFYPFAFSPTWSAQMPSYQADLARFGEYDTQVVGISVDSRFSNFAWVKSMGGFDYPILSDYWPHGEVSEKYGILRPAGSSERALFIINKAGEIVYIDVHEIGKQPDNEELFEELRKL